MNSNTSRREVRVRVDEGSVLARFADWHAQTIPDLLTWRSCFA